MQIIWFSKGKILAQIDYIFSNNMYATVFILFGKRKFDITLLNTTFHKMDAKIVNGNRGGKMLVVNGYTHRTNADGTISGTVGRRNGGVKMKTKSFLINDANPLVNVINTYLMKR